MPLIVVLGAVGLLAVVVIGFLAGQAVERQAESAPTSVPPGRLLPESVLSWEPASGLLELGPPMSVVQFDDGYLAFGAGRQTPGPELGAGVRAYRSEDGRHWTDLGMVIAEAAITAVVPAGDRLLAAGVRYRENLGQRSSGPAVWTSENGRSWQRSALPFEAEADTEYRATVQAGTATDRRAVVVGSVEPDVDAMVWAALPGELREMGDEFGIGWGGSPPSVQVFGPFGFPAFTASFEELGLDPNLGAFSWTWQIPQVIWASDDHGSWEISEQQILEPYEDRRGEMGYPHVEEVLAGPEGQFIARGWGSQGDALWNSSDGHSWRTLWGRGGFVEMTAFKDLLIGSTQNGYGPGRIHARHRHPTLMASTDGETWEMISPDTLFTRHDVLWDLGSLSASSYGIAAVASGITLNSPGQRQQFEFGPPPPAVITRGDLTVSHHIPYRPAGTVTVARNDEILLNISVSPSRPPDHVQFDIGARTMSFLNPESGKNLITLTFDEIEAAHQDLDQQLEAIGPDPTPTESLIVYSPDGQQWTTQSAADVTGLETSSFSRVFALEDFVLALVQPIDPQQNDPTGPAMSPHQPWIGRIP